MSTRRNEIVVSGIPVEVVRKDIKNLHLATYPPQGRVRVAVPLHVDDEAVRLAVVSKLSWIRRQQASFARQERQSAREMVTGESHYVQGRRLRLTVIEEPGRAAVRTPNGSTLALHVPPNTGAPAREAVLLRWYRQLLRNQIPGLITEWEPLVGVTVAGWAVKKMKTCWGTCNVDTGRISLNLELAKKPPECLEFILVHEMVHFLERFHNDRFKEHMDRLMPGWRLRRAELNRAPLRHEKWEY